MGEELMVVLICMSLCGGRLEYLHCNPVIHRSWQKGNPVPGVIVGPPYHWGIYVQRPSSPNWRLDARLMAFLCKKVIVAKSRQVKTTWFNSTQVWQNLLRKAVAQKRLFSQ
jgi:hypothetical protein